MNYTKAILFIISFTISLSFFSCKKGTEPEELKPGRRDYTWTIDSIVVPLLYLTDISGTSPNEIRLSLGRKAVFEKDYFQIESSKNYIIHGKLKD